MRFIFGLVVYVEFDLTQLLPLLTCFASAFVAGYIWAQRRNTRPTSAFLLFNGMVFLCCLNEFFLRLPLGPDIFDVFRRLMGPLLFPLGMLYLEFVLAFTNSRRGPIPWILWVVNACAVAYWIVSPPIGRTLVTSSTLTIMPTPAFVVVFAGGQLAPAAYASWLCIAFIRRHRRTAEGIQLAWVFGGIALSVLIGLGTILVGPMLFGTTTELSSISLLLATAATYHAIRRHYFLSVNVEQTERSFQRLFENVHDAVLLLDSSGNAVQINQSGRQLFGSRTATLTAEELAARIPDYRFDEDMVGEPRTLGTNSHQRFVVVSQSPVKEGDESLGKLLVIRDITQQKRAEEELFRVRSMESIGQLAGGIAHDFNNYLCGIVSSFALARMAVDSNDDEAAEVLAEGEQAALNARGLTEQLLTFSKGGTVRRETFDAAGIVKDMAEFAVRGTSSRLSLVLADDTGTLSGDPTQFGQVVQNLVVNACQAMPDGGIVSVQGRRAVLAEGAVADVAAGEYFELTVADDGEGIPAQIRQRIFDPYFSTKDGGNGLGLAVVYSILKRHGGGITIGSNDGGGAAFTAYFPLTSAPAPPKKAQVKSAESAGGRVLVMDDSDVVRKLLSRLVERLGYDVDSAENGGEALALYEQTRDEGHDYVAVISDLTVVGGMGGRELANQLRSRDPELPIIISSGYSAEVELSRYRDFGFAAVLHKPYEFSELKEVLQRVARAPSTAESGAGQT